MALEAFKKSTDFNNIKFIVDSNFFGLDKNRYFDKSEIKTALKDKFTWALYNGHLDIASFLLESKKINVDDFNEKFWYFGYDHNNNNNESRLNFLIKNGFKMDNRDCDGNYLTHYAANNNKKNILKILVDANVPIDKKNRRDQTPLSLAFENFHEDIIYMLIDAGADVNVEVSNSNTPLHCACYNDSWHLVSLLLSKNAKIWGKNSFGLTPLDIAVAHHHHEIESLFFNKIVSDFIGNGYNIKNLKIDRDENIELNNNSDGNDKILPRTFKFNTKLIFKRDDRDYINKIAKKIGKTKNITLEKQIKYLYNAVKYNNTASVDAIINHFHLDIDTLIEDDKTPLCFAVSNYHIETILYLIINGANVNHSYQNCSKTPLSEAVEKGYSQLVKLLLQNGATEGPELLPISIRNKNHGVANILMKFGDHVNTPDKDGIYPIMLTFSDQYLFNQMVDCEADTDVKDKDNNSLLMLAIIEQQLDIAISLLGGCTEFYLIQIKFVRNNFGKNARDLLLERSKIFGSKDLETAEKYGKLLRSINF